MEVVNQVYDLPDLVCFLEGEKFVAHLHIQRVKAVTQHDFHEELLAYHSVSHHISVKHVACMVLLKYLILVESRIEALTLPNQKVCGTAHLLIGKKVEFAVDFLKCHHKAKVPVRLAKKPRIFRINRRHPVRPQIVHLLAQGCSAL